ncbi:MAG: AlpA family phage regulatory protein [Panacagrimonas sp.]
MDAVESTTGLSRNTIWQRVREHKFPPSVELGGGRVGWRPV